MSSPVLIVDYSAARAAFARVTRVNEQHRHASASSLVLDKLAELGECPVTQACALSTTGRNPAANMLQVFETYRPAGALRGFNERPRNAVVFVFLEPRLLLREFAETALGRLGAALLKTSTASVKIGSDLFDSFPGVTLAVAVGGDIGDAEINAERFKRIDQFWVVDIADAGKVELAAHIHQIDLTLAESEHVALMLAHGGLDLDAAVDSPDRDDIVGLKANDALVVRLCGMLAEDDLRRFEIVGLLCRVSVSDLGDTAHDRLSAKIKPFAGFGIRQLVQIELPGFASLETSLRKPVARLIAALKRVAKQVCLFARRFEFDVRHQLHSFKYRQISGHCQATSN